jgi:hypothetical protein
MITNPEERYTNPEQLGYKSGRAIYKSRTAWGLLTCAALHRQIPKSVVELSRQITNSVGLLTCAALNRQIPKSGESFMAHL